MDSQLQIDLQLLPGALGVLTSPLCSCAREATRLRTGITFGVRQLLSAKVVLQRWHSPKPLPADAHSISGRVTCLVKGMWLGPSSV